MPQPVRVGIMGLGWWACDVHIPNLLRTPGARIAALCSRSREGRQRGLAALGHGSPQPQLFERLEDLLASDAAEAVVLCTPNATHAALTLQALRAGKHVYVEKPLAMDPAACAPIAAEARQRRLVVQVGVELRCSDVVRAMAAAIADGAIGAPVVLRTELWRHWPAPHGWRADERHGTETLHELAVHYLDLLNALAHGRPAWVAAAGGARVTGHQPDHALLTVGYEGGALGAVGLCLFAAGSAEEIRLEVVGAEGRLMGEILTGSLDLWDQEGGHHDLSPPRPDEERFGFPGSREALAAFVRCVRTGESPPAGVTEGEQLCRLCHAAGQSLAAGGIPQRL